MCKKKKQEAAAVEAPISDMNASLLDEYNIIMSSEVNENIV